MGGCESRVPGGQLAHHVDDRPWKVKSTRVGEIGTERETETKGQM